MEGHGAVFSALLHSIWRERHCLDDADDEGLSNHLLGQFAALCRQKNRVAERQTDSCNDHLFKRARRFINANIADPALTPTAVAKALGISTSHLHAIARQGADGRAPHPDGAA